jgi:hypothetical protein
MTLGALIQQYAVARTPARRREVIAKIRRASAPPRIAAVTDACPRASWWILPQLWWELERARITYQDVVALLDDRDGLTVHNACELLVARGWCDRAVGELAAIARGSRDGHAALGALNGLWA